MIHIKYGSLRDPYYGPPPLNAAADILKFEENRLKFANQFFENGAVPAGVLETEQNLGDVLLKKLRGEWSNLHRGVKNAHKVAILQGGLTYKPLTTPIKDLDFSGLKKLSKEDILTIFKVPESVLGSQDGTGSKEGKDALTSFWRGCLIPRLHRLQSGLNRGLRVEIFGNGQYEFEFNLKAVAALQDDKNDIADYVEKMISASVMTPNEGRAIIGLAAMDDEYADKLMVSNSFWGNQKMPVEAAVAGVGGAGSNEELPAAAPPTQPKPKPTKPKAPKK
jgi:HK97 family phage portal protein